MSTDCLPESDSMVCRARCVSAQTETPAPLVDSLGVVGGLPSADALAEDFRQHLQPGRIRSGNWPTYDALMLAQRGVPWTATTSTFTMAHTACRMTRAASST